MTDTVLQIVATGHEKEARNYAVVNKALASGHTMDDRVQVAVAAFKELGVQAGSIASLGTYKFSRNFVAHGMAHDLLREICNATQADWWLNDNKLHIAKAKGTIPGNTIVLNANTGLVGIPEQTIEGVQFNCLLNAAIVPGARVKIDNRSITQAQFSPAYRGDYEQIIPRPEHLGTERGWCLQGAEGPAQRRHAWQRLHHPWVVRRSRRRQQGPARGGRLR